MPLKVTKHEILGSKFVAQSIPIHIVCKRLRNETGKEKFVFVKYDHRFWCFPVKINLKVLTNEKSGGLRVISFDGSLFKLSSRKFSKESVQAPSC